MKANIFIFLILFPLLLFSQSRRDVWRMGYWQGGPIFQMDFHGGNLQIDSINVLHPMSMFTEDAGICDPQGNLLFYTNGIFIANASHDTMMNGSDLNSGPGTITWRNFGMPGFQSAIVLPDPLDSNQYYLFYMVINNNNQLRCDSILLAKIDMRLDNGLGGVTVKNYLLSDLGFSSGQLVAVKHANGRDWWLICHGYNTDYYYSFLITPSGISGPYQQQIGLPFPTPGQACFSPDGTFYASYQNLNDLDIMNFDRCSGLFSNYLHIIIPDTSVAAGCAFSPNSKVLYVSSKNYMYQFDLTSSNIFVSMDTVAIYDGFGDPVGTTFFFQELANDGKIYITGIGTVKHLSVINFPDSLGQSCNVSQHSIALPGFNNGSFPNYPFYELGALGGSVCDSLPTGIMSFRKPTEGFSVFPNPASNDLIVNLDHQKIKSYQVYNSLGQPISVDVYLISNEYLDVNISNLKSGFYNIELMTESMKVVRKFIKQ